MEGQSDLRRHIADGWQKDRSQDCRVLYEVPLYSYKHRARPYRVPEQRPETIPISIENPLDCFPSRPGNIVRIRAEFGSHSAFSLRKVCKLTRIYFLQASA
jgi:hypothetical protein